jgi:nicotinamidase-related amidase
MVATVLDADSDRPVTNICRATPDRRHPMIQEVRSGANPAPSNRCIPPVIKGGPISESPLVTPADCVLVLIDEQAGLAFAAGSADRQVLRSNAVALARTAAAFKVPVVVSTSASKVYSGPLMPPLRAVLPDVTPLERRNMNVWEDDAVRSAILATDRRTLVFAGLLTEACVSFPVLSALAAGHDVRVVADACGGLTVASHDAALRRMEQAGAVMTS